MKRGLILFIFMILSIYYFQYLIYINIKSNNYLFNNKTKQIRNLTVRSFLLSNQTYFELKQFTGLYQQLPNIKTENHNNNDNNNKYNIEDIYFLLTTNTKRIRYTIKFIRFWAKFTNIKCVIVFEEKDYLRTNNFNEYIKNEEILCEILISNITRYEERFFQLIKLGSNYLHQKKNNKFQWFAIGDDDTIWFINNLLKTLQQYNSSKFIYLGNISEKNQTIQHHGNYYAYGGGGILLTKPLVSLISNYSQKCLRKYIHMFGGDEIIGKCITQLLYINLTTNTNFHQIDLEGNIQGFLQSGIDGLVTLHHMFTLWEPFPEEHALYEHDIIQIIQTAYQIFNMDFLKRFYKINFQTNQTLLLTIGYSFTLFNRILTEQELNEIELTWSYQQLYQIKTRSKENNKINWFFKQIINNYSNQQFNYTSIYQNNQQQIQIIFNN